MKKRVNNCPLASLILMYSKANKSPQKTSASRLISWVRQVLLSHEYQLLCGVYIALLICDRALLCARPSRSAGPRAPRQTRYHYLGVNRWDRRHCFWRLAISSHSCCHFHGNKRSRVDGWTDGESPPYSMPCVLLGDRLRKGVCSFDGKIIHTKTNNGVQ